MILSDAQQRRMLALGSEALARYGAEHEANRTIDGCAELIVALRHFGRGRATVEDIASEIADVQIMCGHMAQLVGQGLVSRHVDKKLDRLEKRLNEPRGCTHEGIGLPGCDTCDPEAIDARRERERALFAGHDANGSPL